MKVTSAAIRSCPRHWDFIDSLSTHGNTGRKTLSHVRKETLFREEEKFVQGNNKKMTEQRFNPVGFFVTKPNILPYVIKTEPSKFYTSSFKSWK